MQRRISVRAIVFDNGKLLCVRLKQYAGAMSVSKDEWWCTPGGGLDGREGLADGIRREMLEETGINVIVGNLLYLQQFILGNDEHLEFFFHITNPSDFYDIDLSKSSHGQKEIAEIKFADAKDLNILPKFLATEDIAGKITARDSPKIFYSLR